MSVSVTQWGRIPLELRQRKQWVIAGANKEPLALGSRGLYRVKVTEPDQWMDFESAAAAAVQHGLGIGYVLHESDPYTCIDLDVKDATNEEDPSKWTTPQQYDRFWAIAQQFDSYAETSRSGKGLHIWCRGDIGQGMRRDGVEVYSRERYIICTGSVILDRPIHDRQDLLNGMVTQMRGPKEADLLELVEEEEELPDSEIIHQAMYAGNGDKFNELCAGDWKRMGYPSQSEADLALMSMFAYYSKSNEQCRRLFRMSNLGKRDKAMKDDRHLNYTLRVIRNRQAREAAAEANAEYAASQLIAKLNADYEASVASPLHVPGPVEPVQYPPPASAAATLAGPVHAAVAAPPRDNGLPWPPGMAGAIAGFIYQSAPRPVREVAIVAALGFLAGICGKAYSIPQSGLNIYMILIARSAVGKEALHSGISALCKAAYDRCPSITDFVNFSDFASGPALVKEIVGQQSMVNVAGEWGRKLKRMAHDDGRDGPLASLRTVMTNLYQKSGPQAIVGGITYSNKDSNIASVSGVAYSMIGETTPGTFFESLTETMMEDGFLSRFTIVEYNGERPPLNAEAITVPPQALTDSIANLGQHARHLIGINQNVAVTRCNESAILLQQFEQECDAQINSTTDESWRQMWNRASLKVMRIAALLAVADNWFHPQIQVHHVQWALDLIRRDIAIMSKRIDDGDVGIGDDSRERKLLAVCGDYLTGKVGKGYGVPDGMQSMGIVPRKYLLARCGRATAFSGHRMGSSGALDITLRSLCDSGYLMEVDKNKMIEQYSFHGKCYRILDLPNYDAQRVADAKKK